MSISFGMVIFGALLIIAGWQDKSLGALARGDNTVAKPQVLAGRGNAAQSTTGPAANAPTPPPGPASNYPGAH